MKHSRAMVVEATSTAEAMDGDTCKTFNAKPVLISQTSESEVALKEINKTFKVINNAETAVEVGDRLVVVQDISGFWIRVEPETGCYDQIQGELTALDNGTGDFVGKKVATITVTVAARDSSLLGTSVEVVDHSSCVFDKTEAELMGVWVWANKGVALSSDPYAEAGQLTPCHWVAADRCCIEGEAG